ncbi:MAG: TerD family protein [Alphaproteobacteria bacterium]
MNILKGPAKGQSEAINISKTSRDRVLIGLSWDMKKLEKIKLPKPQQIHIQSAVEEIENVIHRYRTFKFLNRPVNEHDAPDARDSDFAHFDLDLYCYIFDDSGELVEMIGPDYTELVEDSGSAYHSGDDFSGLGGGDDEQIYIETKNLPENYKKFLICVKSDCAFSLDEIDNPVIRIADGQSDEDFLRVAISPAANLNASAFIFAQVYHDGADWVVENIGEYADAGYDIGRYFKEG